ncbi:MAG: helix-turn-helix domain-containing protein [Faecousia sp.]
MPRIRQKAEVYRNEDFRREALVRLAYLGLNQRDLAEYLGVSYSTVSLMLRTPDKMPVERLRKVISFLKLEPEVALRLLGYPEKTIREVV